MRVIRPAAMATGRRRRFLILALSMLATGVLAAELALVGSGVTVAAAGAMASAAAIGLGVGVAWLVRVASPDRLRSASELLEQLVGDAFDDSYALILSPQLPIRDAERLDGLLIGPAGVRAMTVRDWEGRYRVRGRGWEFEVGGRRGWIPCRTNPSFDAAALADGVARWAAQAGLPNLPIRGAVAFPLRRSRLVLEEPDEEVVTTDNAPWWANSFGRLRRLEPGTGAALISAVLDAAEAPRRVSAAAPESRASG